MRAIDLNYRTMQDLRQRHVLRFHIACLLGFESSHIAFVPLNAASPRSRATTVTVTS